MDEQERALALKGKRNIPSLDGLRAFSVLAVILGHTQAAVLDRIPGNALFRNGSQAVSVFFVLSGFLITHLLLSELKHEHAIDLKRFYFRRTFRIFPPFYVFLIVVAVLALLHRVPATLAQLSAAGTYTWNYIPLPENWALGHSWSLCLEEQFYLLWPACMAFFSKKTNLWLAAGVVLLSPLSRVLTYYSLPSMRYHMDMMLHTHLDTIMMGCILALLVDMHLLRRALHAATRGWAAAIAIVFLLLVDTPLSARYEGIYRFTVGISLESLAIAVLVLFCVFRHESWLGKVLNWKPVKHVGRISYSLYLWQQLFTGPYTRFFPLNLVCIVACAELSFYLVERPSLRLRDRVARRFSSRPHLVPAQEREPSMRRPASVKCFDRS